MSLKYDAVLFTIPPVLLQGPHLAPALLKAYAARHGYSIKCLNFSMELFDGLPDDMKFHWPYNDFEAYFAERPDDLEKHLKYWSEQIMSYSPKLIGLSTHAWSSVYFLKKISRYIKENYPESTLVLGGPPTLEIGNSVLKDKIIDYYVGGDGEEALINMLEGKFDHPNINSKRPVGISNEEFENLPIPDFSDSRFDEIKERYPLKNKIYLISSRGCVFNCSFCNVPYMTQKFRYKSGQKFAEEVFAIKRQYDPSIIELADSLINGSMKIYREFISSVIEMNKDEKIKFHFDAFFRVRNPKSMTEKDFELSAKAGIKRIRIGVESGSPDVRNHIGKKETNDDIFYTLEMCKKYGIAVNVLMLIGYVNETEERFKESVEFLKEIRRRDLDWAIDTVVVNELYFSEGTRLKEMKENLNVEGIGATFDAKSEREWTRVMEDGVVNNWELRNKRVQEIKVLVKKEFRALGKVIAYSKTDESCEFNKSGS